MKKKRLVLKFASLEFELPLSIGASSLLLFQYVQFTLFSLFFIFLMFSGKYFDDFQTETSEVIYTIISVSIIVLGIFIPLLLIMNIGIKKEPRGLVPVLIFSLFASLSNVISGSSKTTAFGLTNIRSLSGVSIVLLVFLFMYIAMSFSGLKKKLFELMLLFSIIIILIYSLFTDLSIDSYVIALFLLPLFFEKALRKSFLVYPFMLIALGTLLYLLDLTYFTNAGWVIILTSYLLAFLFLSLPKIRNLKMGKPTFSFKTFSISSTLSPDGFLHLVYESLKCFYKFIPLVFLFALIIFDVNNPDINAINLYKETIQHFIDVFSNSYDKGLDKLFFGLDSSSTFGLSLRNSFLENVLYSGGLLALSGYLIIIFYLLKTIFTKVKKSGNGSALELIALQLTFLLLFITPGYSLFLTWWIFLSFVLLEDRPVIENGRVLNKSELLVKTKILPVFSIACTVFLIYSVLNNKMDIFG